MSEPKPMCLDGLHQAVAQKISDRISPPATVLDVAAGSGAFVRRLMEMGFGVAAGDISSESWRLDGVELLNVDLNAAFASRFDGLAVDAVAAIEVIEHLENPREFLRQCLAIVPPGGWLFVTTPNVTSAASRAMFLASGRTVFFEPNGACRGDHITFLPWWLLADHAAAAGWEVVETDFAGRYESQRFVVRIARLLAGLFGRYSPGEKKYGCTLMTLRRP